LTSISLHNAIKKLIVTIDERVQQGGVVTVGIPTGFKSLDQHTGGLRKSAIYIIGGRPGMGKSGFAFALAKNVAKQDLKVLFLSLEMPAELMALRALSAYTGIPSERIERGQLSQQEFQAVQTAVKDTENITFDIIDGSVKSDEFITTMMSKGSDAVDLIVIDYVSLFRDPSRYGETERVTNISTNLMTLRSVLQIPLVVLAQLNREVEKRENHIPILSDLRDSGALEQDAFFVGFCYRPHYYNMMFDGEAPLEVEKDASIIIAKNRQGQIGQVPLWFYPAQTLWTDVEERLPTLPSPTHVIPESDGPLTRKVKEKR
jgi:replicative DNA helicase